MLEQLADVVRREIGMSIRGPALTSLEAALRRMDPTMDAAAFLRAGGEETAATALLERLIDEVTVKETFFFRQREEFDAIDWSNLHRAARDAGSETVRVWVAACASGEEAYTLGILASEAFGSPDPPVSILATDISAAALDRAARGRYRGRTVRTVDPELRERHFVVAGGDLVVGEPLRRMVELRRHNLVRDCGPPSAHQQFELIACRNVLIYFDGDVVERVIGSLERALAPEGMLVLGAADRLCGSARRLAHLDTATRPHRTARRSVPEPTLRRPLGRDTARPPDSAPPPAQADPANDALAEALQAADAGRLDAAVEVTTRMLAEDPFDADAQFVRGLAELGLGEADAAVNSLRRALYVDPTFGAAAFKLGRAHEELGDDAAAARAYEQALRTLEAGSERHEAVLHEVDVGDVAAACALRLRALHRSGGRR